MLLNARSIELAAPSGPKRPELSPRAWGASFAGGAQSIRVVRGGLERPNGSISDLMSLKTTGFPRNFFRKLDPIPRVFYCSVDTSILTSNIL